MQTVDGRRKERGMTGAGAYAVHPAFHTQPFLKALPPPAEVEGAWDALEGQRDAIEFDRICTTN